MKLLSSVVISLMMLSSFAGGFTFPNIPYHHARIYLFNTGEETEVTMPEFSIFRNGIYASSKLGDGWELTTEMNERLNEIFAQGIDAMASGLSSCYLPRHGIIYFNEIGKPVASTSICFECQRVTFWSTKTLPEFSSDYSKKAADRALKQFENMEAVFVKNEIPVFKLASEYRTHLVNNKKLYEDNGEMVFDYSNTSAFGKKDFNVETIKSLILESNFKLKEANETAFSLREENKRSIEYLTLTSIKGTKIIFSSTAVDAIMTEATIIDPEITLPNGISVGMSLSQVQDSFQVWDGMAYPASIVVNYSDATLRYLFKNRTLVKIEVVMLEV